MVGRTDKGLFITTGYFTRDAIKEATRDGAPTIDLIDGEKLIEKFKELNLGVSVELIEKISVNEKWFEAI
jgi:restriction system protein